MEEKLNQLKDKFCKWYCDKGDIKIIPSCTLGSNCNTYYVSPCKYCKVNDFIRHIRDEL